MHHNGALGTQSGAFRHLGSPSFRPSAPKRLCGISSESKHCAVSYFISPAAFSGVFARRTEATTAGIWHNLTVLFCSAFHKRSRELYPSSFPPSTVPLSACATRSVLVDMDEFTVQSAKQSASESSPTGANFLVCTVFVL